MFYFYKRVSSLFIVSVFLIVLGCVPTVSDSSSVEPGISIAVITHGGVGDSFWDVVKKGSEQAGDDLGITVQYQGTGDPSEQSRLIQTAISQNVQGLVVSLANADALESAVRQAVSSNIPVITINSGLDSYKDFGAMTHIGQTEYIAGQGAGEKFADEGVRNLLVVIHEQGNIGLEERADGAAEILAGMGGSVERFYVTGTTDVAASTAEIQAKLQANATIDGVLTLNPVMALAARDAIKGSQSSALLGSFDLNGDVVDAIEAGEILFSVDQQQYLQGYLPVVFLYLQIMNANTTGGGLPVLTGPGFVDVSNAATVKELAAAGTR